MKRAKVKWQFLAVFVGLPGCVFLGFFIDDCSLYFPIISCISVNRYNVRRKGYGYCSGKNERSAVQVKDTATLRILRNTHTECNLQGHEMTTSYWSSRPK